MPTPLSAFLLLALASGAQVAPPARAYSLNPVSGAIVVDGALDDEAWRNAVIVDLPFETSPGRNTPAGQATVCRLAIDRNTLYFGCEAADDDPSRIRAFFTDRDQIGGQDRTGLAIDTDADMRKAYVFSVSPLGVQGDLLFDQERLTESSEWDAIWTSAGRLTPAGYTVEAAIPLRALRFPNAGEPRNWRFYFWRTRPRSTSTEFRSTPDDTRGNCALCTASPLDGIPPLRSGGALDLTPTLTAARAGRRSAAGERAGDGDVQAGLDARWAFTSSLSLNVTVNPDFSQVEADVAELDVNTRFALSYPERRPFFLEGRDLFQTPTQLVHTRTIADPRAGVKLSGRAGDTRIGVLVARDETTNVLLPRLDGSRLTTLDGESTTAVARVIRDVGRRTAIGLLYTSRTASGYANRAAGADVVIRPSSALTIVGQVTHSTASDPAPGGAVRSEGNSAYSRVNYVTREWNVEGSYERTSPGFRADAGFVGQVGFSQRRITGRRTFWPGRPWITSLTLAAAHWPLDDPSGRLFSRWQYLAVDYRGPWQSRVGVYARRRTERYLGTTYDFSTPYYGLEVRPGGAFSVVTNIYAGKAIAYTHATLADNLDVRPEINVQAARHVAGQLRYNYQRLSRASHTLLRAHLTQGRLTWNLNTRTFARVIAQRRDTWERTIAGQAVSGSSLVTQWLFSYKVNPETVFYAGYSGSVRDLDGDVTPPAGVARSSRTLFFKLGYAFRP